MKINILIILLLQLAIIKNGYCRCITDFGVVDKEEKRFLWTGRPYFTYVVVKGVLVNCSDVTLNNDTPLKSVITNLDDSAKDAKLITVEHSTVYVIDSGIFDTFKLVQKLILKNDNVTDIQPNSFASMSNLTELYLNNNNLKNIRNGVFTGIENSLRKLNLCHNNIETLNEINRLTNLEELNVTNNKIVTLSTDTFHNANKLIVLHLARNSLKNLDFISQMSSLQYLNLSYNLLQTVSKRTFDSLPSLVTLDLNHNKLAALEPKLFINCHNLTNLYLKNNSLETFTNDLFYNSISYLDISLNYLKVFQCEQIQGSAVFPFNTLTTVCNFGKNTTWIDFSENDLSELKNGSFKHLILLTHLNLTMNFLTKIDTDSFENLHNLTLLSISKNSIAELPIGIFSPLISLEYLDFSHNIISELNHGIFTGLTELITLNMSHNGIEYLDTNVFYPLINLKELHLAGNPLITLDSYDITNHLNDLNQISFNIAKVSCDDLAQIIKRLNGMSVNVKQGHFVKGSNIHGIECETDDVAGVDRRRHEEEFLRVKGYITAFMSSLILISVMFILLFISYFISWHHKFINRKVYNLKKNGASCSTTMLTEDDHD